MNRRNLLMMTGAAALAAAVPYPRAGAEPLPPGQPANPGAPPPDANPGPVDYILVDDFDGPAGAARAASVSHAGGDDLRGTTGA